jgi:outer membrane protein W
MKRILGLIMAAVLFSGVGYASASTIGGAETSGQGIVAAAFEQEVVFERKMRQDKGKTTGVAEGQDISSKPKIEGMNTSLVKISYGLLDNLDVYVKLGGGNVKTTGDWLIEDVGGSMKLKSDYGFTYGLGAKGTYNLTDDWFVGCDIQYLRSETDYKGTFDIEEMGEYGFSGNSTWQAWQVAPYVALKAGNFVPYLGIKYSDLIQKYKNDNTDISNGGFPMESLTTRSKGNCGVFVGTDYRIGTNWKLNIEGRFIDETAMSLGASYKF